MYLLLDVICVAGIGVLGMSRFEGVGEVQGTRVAG